MIGPNRDGLTIALDILIVVMFALMIAGLSFQIYAFNQYRSDVQGNRALLCEAPVLHAEKYCQDFRTGTMPTEGGPP